ncbi:MAG: hypothetical protein WBP41_20700 [Saprospiraceae bacterium]
MILSELWNKIRQSPSFRPSRISIRPENTDVADKLNMQFHPDQEYFLVRVNEMFLSFRRKWFTTFDPMVFITSEFLYDGKKVSIPFVVGDSLVKDKIELPQGMIFSNTTVAGLHPFKGGSLAISLVLNQVPKNNYLQNMMKIIQSAAGTYTNEFSAVASGYLKIAKVVVDGIDAMTDSDGVKPLMGIRDEYGNEENLRPGYFALINTDEQEYDTAKFYVKNHELCYGSSITTAEPFRADDYVLYSIFPKTERSDVSALPFYQTWKELNTYLSNFDRKLTDDEKRKARGKLFAMGNEMKFSADLTGTQAVELIKTYKAELEKMIAEYELLSGSEKSIKEETVGGWESEIDATILELLR